MYSSTRFGCEPGEEDITINYFGKRSFEVQGKNIARPLIFAADNALDPDVPKGAMLLVNERQTTVDKSGYYVFRSSDSGNSFDIALMVNSNAPRAERSTIRISSTLGSAGISRPVVTSD